MTWMVLMDDKWLNKRYLKKKNGKNVIVVPETTHTAVI